MTHNQSLHVGPTPSPLTLRQNGRSSSPSEESHQRSPSPRFRHYSGSTTPTRTPTPTFAGEGEERPHTKTKSVSFHSQTNSKKDRKIQSAYDCLQYMIEGSSMIKLRSNGRQYHRYFSLLQDLSAIQWTPTSKKSCRAKVPIDQIREIRTGRNCESLRHKNFSSGYNEDRIFSILHSSSYESLDLIALTPEEANIWVTGLNALIGAAHSPETDEDPFNLRETWLRQAFEKAPRDHSGYIDQATCIDLVKRLDSQIATLRIKQKLLEVDQSKTDGDRGRVGIQDFIDIFSEVSTRPEIYFLMIRYANKDYLTRDDFHLFLEGEQGMSGLTEEMVSEMISKYEPSSEARKCGHILVDGFTKYLLSEDCDIFDSSQKRVCQDMSQPLTHYFISTSHNTYLLEDQLKGPSSIDGYIRVLTCGCRCVKVDVFDGPEEPIVYHGNTLTSKVLFREVIDAIASYSFDYSIYPVFVHLENHCSIRQQRVMAELIKALFGRYLYVHPQKAQKRLSDLSPEDLKFKIILMGKTLPEGILEGDVSDEDEGGGETKKKSNQKKIKLCYDLSSLISISRNSTLNLQSQQTDKVEENIWSMNESTTGELIHGRSEEVVEHSKSNLMRVFPNSSRVDSSNYNPQDFWNAGVQMVALNFQTPGQMMDVYEGRFRGNGACGYVLKPSVMREQISVFCANSREAIPGVTPHLLKIKIISGQCLPKPRGSSAVKASFIDPKVVIQVFGIKADCAEANTRTVSDDGNCPIFDESFDFMIHLPEMALLRFLVLDDECIGDDFIGQATVSFDCLQTGYRHIRLLSSMGEPIDNATLFVHVAVSSTKGRKPQSSWGRRAPKLQSELKGVGIKEADDIFKETVAALSFAKLREYALESAWSFLQKECGLDHTANIKQCLKVVISRFLGHPGNPSLSIVRENDISFLRSSISGSLPSHLHKLEIAVEKLLLEIHDFIKESDNMKRSLEEHLEPALLFYENFDQSLSSHGIRGKKAGRARENFAFNVRVIRGQLERLAAMEKKCKVAMDQVDSTNVTLQRLNSRDRSPHCREKPKLNLSNRHNTSENLSTYGSLGRSPTIPDSIIKECKPKSILKKSNSNIESRSLGYVCEDACSIVQFPAEALESDQSLLLKPPLHHSLSYTPGCHESDSARSNPANVPYNLISSDDYRLNTGDYPNRSASHESSPSSYENRFSITDQITQNCSLQASYYDSSSNSYDSLVQNYYDNNFSYEPRNESYSEVEETSSINKENGKLYSSNTTKPNKYNTSNAEFDPSTAL